MDAARPRLAMPSSCHCIDKDSQRAPLLIPHTLRPSLGPPSLRSALERADTSSSAVAMPAKLPVAAYSHFSLAPSPKPALPSPSSPLTTTSAPHPGLCSLTKRRLAGAPPFLDTGVHGQGAASIIRQSHQLSRGAREPCKAMPPLLHRQPVGGRNWLPWARPRRLYLSLYEERRSSSCKNRSFLSVFR